MAYLTGILFFAGTLYWFIHVTVIGAILLILYLAVYFGIFGLFYSVFTRHKAILKLFLLPSAWVLLEFLRAHLLSGFGWCSLAHAQYQNLPLIQMADITGVYGISFIVVMVNVFWKTLFDYYVDHKINLKTQLPIISLTVITVVGICEIYGFWRLSTPLKPFSYAKIAIVQGNVIQQEKWMPDKWPEIMQRYLRLTQKAQEATPDIIIWPETAFPGYIWERPKEFKRLEAFVKKGKIPLVVGTVTREGHRYFNSALLISKQGRVSHLYDKIHLVPFGEYVPLRGVLPFLGDLVGIGDFTPGRCFSLFPVFPKENGRFKPMGHFAVLICFEDTIPELTAEFVRKGANVLVNITNDAWFEDTIAPFLHMQAALFRAIETRRALVRVANTGVSCFISPKGNVVSAVRDKQGRWMTYIGGIAIEKIPFLDDITFYTRFGDIFIILTIGGVVWGLLKRDS